ncbi:MAG: hypothetical protein JW736_09450, partial [Deltaproteobacteria bacterium]|nr:hypothetical protein [Deltaproteobacteria bacterium]
SSKSRYYLHSSYRWLDKLRKLRPHPKAEIHPETAARYEIADGDDIVIETTTGKITQVAQVTESVDPRVVNASHGWWYPEGNPRNQYDWDRSNLNILTSSAKLGREYGTPNLKNLPCRIRKA